MASLSLEPLQAVGNLPTLKTISSEREFFAMRDEWNSLLASSRSDCFFLTWEWLATWWKHLGSGFELAIHTVDIDGQLIAIAPFVRRPARPLEGRLIPTLEFLGNGFAGSDYLDIMVRGGYEDVAVPALARFLVEGANALRLSNVLHPDSIAAAVISRLEKDGWNNDRIEINVCPYIDLQGHTWESYLVSLGSETRYNFNRKWKRLNRDFAVEFVMATAETVADSLETAIALHADRWSERGGSDAFHTTGLVNFHREIATLALERCWLRLFTLKLNGTAAASLYGFAYRNRFYFYQSGLDRTFDKHSVGFLTMGLAIQHSLSEHDTEYDLLHGAEAYKFHWTKTARPIYRFENYPPSLSGAAARGLLQMGRISRNVARRVLSSTPK